MSSFHFVQARPDPSRSSPTATSRLCAIRPPSSAVGVGKHWWWSQTHDRTEERIWLAKASAVRTPFSTGTITHASAL